MILSAKMSISTRLKNGGIHLSIDIIVGLKLNTIAFFYCHNQTRLRGQMSHKKPPIKAGKCIICLYLSIKV